VAGNVSEPATAIRRMTMAAAGATKPHAIVKLPCGTTSEMEIDGVRIHFTCEEADDPPEPPEEPGGSKSPTPWVSTGGFAALQMASIRAEVDDARSAGREEPVVFRRRGAAFQPDRD